jgi:hypothetical protein
MILLVSYVGRGEKEGGDILLKVVNTKTFIAMEIYKGKKGTRNPEEEKMKTGMKTS